MPADQSLIDAAVELAAKLQGEAVALQTVSERGSRHRGSPTSRRPLVY